MLLNNEQSLASNPINLSIRRSKFKLPEEHQLDFSSGELIPIYLNMDVLPGDTISMNMSALIRLSTPIYPTMDTAFADVYFFAIPKRLLWEHWPQFVGEDSNTYWTTPTEYTIPQIDAPASTGWDVHTVADYMGIPPGVTGFSVDALPFRAYALCWNTWFRSESLTQPVSISLGDATVTGTNATWSNYITDGSLGGMPLRVARMHDIFSSALWEPQAGAAVTIPLGDWAPVVTSPASAISSHPLQNASTAKIADYPIMDWDYATNGATYWSSGDTTNSFNIYRWKTGGNTVYKDESNPGSLTGGLVPSNLIADISNVSAISIETLREAFAVQRILECINRGSRYIEIIKNAYSVQVPDYRMQRPEFLGGKRIPITMAEINQTSSTDATSPLGHPGAASKTLMSEDLFTWSCLEHSVVLGVMCVRPVHTYSQGLKRDWRKRTRFEYYWPDLANIGDQFIKNSEIYLQSDSVVDSDGNVVNDLPFGYQEAWYEYRNSVNQLHGRLRTQVNQSLSVWNYGDLYNSLPTLSTDWLYEDGSQIGRTIAVQTQPQFIADIFFNPTYVRPMPLYSVPGLDTRF